MNIHPRTTLLLIDTTSHKWVREMGYWQISCFPSVVVTVDKEATIWKLFFLWFAFVINIQSKSND